MSRERVPFLFTLDVHELENLEGKLNASADALNEAGIAATYFVQANLVEKHKIGPILRRLVADGHQVASHALLHGLPEDFKNDPLEVQIGYLRRAKELLENETGGPVTAFRAPSFRLSAATLVALEETGHRADVSINSQRLGFLSSDMKNLGWYYAPRTPYHPSAANPHRRGDLKLWEIPLTALGIPFMSNLYLFFSMGVTRAFTKLLEWEARHLVDKPLVYMAHPEEFFPTRNVKNKLELSWRLFVPHKTAGIRLRYLFKEVDEYAIFERTVEMTRFLASRRHLSYLTVDQYLERLEATS